MIAPFPISLFCPELIRHGLFSPASQCKTRQARTASFLQRTLALLACKDFSRWTTRAGRGINGQLQLDHWLCDRVC